MVLMIILGVLLIFILAVVLSSIKVVNTGYLYVVERFGQFDKVLEPGWHFIIPFVDFVRKKSFYKATNFRCRTTISYN